MSAGTDELRERVIAAWQAYQNLARELHEAERRERAEWNAMYDAAQKT